MTEPEGWGRVIGQRGITQFLLRTGENSGRVVDVGKADIAADAATGKVAAGAVTTVPNLALELTEGDWGEVTDGDGAEEAVSLAAQSEARWRKTAGDLIGIDFGGGKEDGEGN